MQIRYCEKAAEVIDRFLLYWLRFRREMRIYELLEDQYADGVNIEQ